MTEESKGDNPHLLARQISLLIKEKFLEVPGEIEPHADLFDLGLDSMGIMQLIISLEESLGVRIPSEAVTQDNFRTSSRIAALVGRMANAGAH